ncbi:MAG: FtsH protease activity modulator HflK [Thermotogota bacterium]|nr:FtsH protease activity modulator HflK [Thermotogota bacterium]
MDNNNDELFGDIEPRKDYTKLIKIIVPVIIIAVIAIYFLTGFYRVEPAEVVLVKRFGEYQKQLGPGLHYHLPYPIESIVIVNVSELRKKEIGFQTIAPARYSSRENEALMLTGDGNIAYAEAVVQYFISDAEKFAFNLKSDEDIVKSYASSALREEVAAVTADEILTVSRNAIAMRTADRVQQELDKLGVGIQIKNVYLQEVSPPQQVIASFDDVNSAKQDREQLIYKAEEYKNEIIPKAEGRSNEILNEAEAYARSKVLKAQGESSRFTSILEEYINAPRVTKTRLYLETVDKVLGESEKIITTNSEDLLKFFDITGYKGGGSQ